MSKDNARSEFRKFAWNLTSNLQKQTTKSSSAEAPRRGNKISTAARKGAKS